MEYTVLCLYLYLWAGSPVPQATLFPFQLGEEEGSGPWTFWQKLSILYGFAHHAAYEGVNTAVWRLPGNSTVPTVLLAVTDNTVAAEVSTQWRNSMFQRNVRSGPFLAYFFKSLMNISRKEIWKRKIEKFKFFSKF